MHSVKVEMNQFKTIILSYFVNILSIFFHFSLLSNICSNDFTSKKLPNFNNVLEEMKYYPKGASRYKS